jgi:Zn-dependent membrane protease YugP
MVLLAILGIVVLMALIAGPQLLIHQTLRKHAPERADFPGTGGELARHLLDDAGLEDVKLDVAPPMGDHYSPDERVVRLSEANLKGKSVTAVAVAAHEVAHAIQHRDGYAPLLWRQKWVQRIVPLQQVGMALLFLTPILFAMVKSPAIMIAELGIAFAVMASGILIHLATLPTEFDASFNKALPVLENYLPPEDMKGARAVLRAAAFTYVASALMSLINMLRVFRRV